MISRVKGTQDFLDLTLFNFIVDVTSKHLALYSFHQITTRIVEHTELFNRSLGAHTDVISKEMFIVSGHKVEHDESMCLRPEATAPIVRVFIENGVQQTPWKVFTGVLCFDMNVRKKVAIASSIKLVWK